jgi:hypothetical protein
VEGKTRQKKKKKKKYAVPHPKTKGLYTGTASSMWPKWPAQAAPGRPHVTQLGFWVLSFEVEEEGERGDIAEKNEEEREPPPPPSLQRSSTAGSSK